MRPPIAITLFEHQPRTYEEIGLSLDHPVIEQLDRLNAAAGCDLMILGRKTITATQQVGIIRAGNVTFEILPKIDYDPLGQSDDPIDSQTYTHAAQSATRNLLFLLSYVFDLTIHEQEIAALAKQHASWLELLTRLFATDLHRQMQSGITHNYVRHEEILPVLRGRWNLGRQLMHRPYSIHQFDVTFDEFSPDHPLNQIFRFVVEQLLWQTQDPSSRALLLDLNEWLYPVHRHTQIPFTLVDQITFSRLTERFGPAFNLAKLFLSGNTPQLSVGRDNLYAFVFDMNMLFERFITQFIICHRINILPEVWRNTLIRPQSQGVTCYLAHRFLDDRPAVLLRPDILFTMSSTAKPWLIIDAKYKQLVSNRRSLNISNNDVHQMLAYVTRFDCSRAMLLYPNTALSDRQRQHLVIDSNHSHLLINTINLRQPLQDPRPLIGELREIFQSLPLMDG